MRGSGYSVPASDVYSIGVLLYEGLTGKHPFDHIRPSFDIPEAEHSEWIYEHRKNVKPQRPATLSASVSPHLDDVVMRCLEFKVEHRFRDAAALEAALDPPRIDNGEAELERCRRLRNDGALDAARAGLQRILSDRTKSKEIRFALLRELGIVLALLGRHNESAEHLVQAWELAKDSAILRSRRERAELLEGIENEFRAQQNNFMADRYKREKERERGTRS
jgi:serine/threonine protein kinase